MFIELTKTWQSKPPGERLDLPEADAKKLIEDGHAKALDHDPIAQAIDAAMARAQKQFDAAIDAKLSQFTAAQAKSRKNAVPIIFGESSEGDPRLNFGDLCAKAAQKQFSAIEKTYSKLGVHINAAGNGFVLTPTQQPIRKKAAMGEASGVTGGYTVPPDFYNQLLAIIEESTFIRQHAFVQPMASATLQFPYLDITTAQAAGISPFFGGVQMNWTAEAQTRTETEPAFKMMELKANELSGYSVSSNILLQDAAFGLEAFLMQLFGRAVAWFEEFAFLQGNGVGKPQGMLTAGAAIAVTRTTAGAHVVYNDVATMWSKLLPSSVNEAIWTCSPSVIPQLLQLQDGANRAIFISIDQGATQRPIWRLLGAPVFITEKVPALGTKGDLMLLDCSKYVIGDRMQIEIAASEHVNFLTNQMTWRVVERVDGQPWMEKPITLQDTVTQVSPFVVLN